MEASLRRFSVPHRPISSVFSAWTFWIGFPVCRWRILGVRKTVPASICCFRHLLRARGLIGLVGPLWPPMRALVALVFDARRVLRGLLEDLLPFGGCILCDLFCDLYQTDINSTSILKKHCRVLIFGYGLCRSMKNLTWKDLSSFRSPDRTVHICLQNWPLANHLQHGTFMYGFRLEILCFQLLTFNWLRFVEGGILWIRNLDSGRLHSPGWLQQNERVTILRHRLRCSLDQMACNDLTNIMAPDRSVLIHGYQWAVPGNLQDGAFRDAIPGVLWCRMSLSGSGSHRLRLGHCWA
mmetsp:Transcript_8775/g.18630  ORF Transcript_8775/g.18630 Transcript_8775/m.18630 type:complete len:295 (+) Transcript_8775:426-1310(+)